MRFEFWQRGSLLSVAVFAVVLSGCGQADSKSGQTKDKDAKGKSSEVAQTKQEEKEGKPGHEWWCDEHGVPEAECSMCSAKVAAECKKKGDWCEKHDRAKSQCFICNPKLRDKYAAIYRAKYGKEPPEPTDNMPAKEDEKKK